MGKSRTAPIDTFPERGQWRSIAEDIGVSPEDFYRELQRRRRG
jgi:hypothetical protein